MKHQPANFSNINLVPTDPFFITPLGRVLRWALSAGRYLVIFTELIVIISFATRFKLDRDLTDLNDSIFHKKNLIESYGQLEKDFRQIQDKISYYSELEKSKTSTDVFVSLTEITPKDVVITKLTVSSSDVVIVGSTISQAAFNILITNLQLSPNFHNITVSKVEQSSQSEGFDFQLKAETNGGESSPTKSKQS